MAPHTHQRALHTDQPTHTGAQLSRPSARGPQATLTVQGQRGRHLPLAGVWEATAQPQISRWEHTTGVSPGGKNGLGGRSPGEPGWERKGRSLPPQVGHQQSHHKHPPGRWGKDAHSSARACLLACSALPLPGKTAGRSPAPGVRRPGPQPRPLPSGPSVLVGTAERAAGRKPVNAA